MHRILDLAGPGSTLSKPLQKCQNEKTTHVECSAVHILFVNHTRFGAAVKFIVACFSAHSLPLIFSFFCIRAQRRAQRMMWWWQQPLIVCINWLHLIPDNMLAQRTARKCVRYARWSDFVTYFRLGQINRERYFFQTLTRSLWPADWGKCSLFIKVINEWLTNFDKIQHQLVYISIIISLSGWRTISSQNQWRSFLLYKGSSEGASNSNRCVNSRRNNIIVWFWYV